MNIRLKRLQADYEKIMETFKAGGRILIKAVTGNPPEKYQIEFLVNSLVMKPDGSVTVKNNHLAEIFLTRSYPRQPPQCRMLTPVFHPNIAPHAICIGDHWAAGESLSHLIVRIGEMLAYQSYNLKSPLNGEAAKWVDKNRSRFPIDTMDFASYYEAGEKTLSEQQVVAIDQESTMVCANCNTRVQGAQIIICSSKHPVCSNCALSCSACGRQLCLKCLTSTCSACGQIVCAHCHFKCRSCQTDLCPTHTIACHICNAPGCSDCSVECSACGKPACLDHIRQVPATGEYRCHACNA